MRNSIRALGIGLFVGGAVSIIVDVGAATAASPDKVSMEADIARVRVCDGDNYAEVEIDYDESHCKALAELRDRHQCRYQAGEVRRLQRKYNELVRACKAKFGQKPDDLPQATSDTGTSGSGTRVGDQLEIPKTENQPGEYPFLEMGLKGEPDPSIGIGPPDFTETAKDVEDAIREGGSIVDKFLGREEELRRKADEATEVLQRLSRENAGKIPKAEPIAVVEPPRVGVEEEATGDVDAGKVEPKKPAAKKTVAQTSCPNPFGGQRVPPNAFICLNDNYLHPCLCRSGKCSLGSGTNVCGPPGPGIIY